MQFKSLALHLLRMRVPPRCGARRHACAMATQRTRRGFQLCARCGSVPNSFDAISQNAKIGEGGCSLGLHPQPQPRPCCSVRCQFDPLLTCTHAWCAWVSNGRLAQSVPGSTAGGRGGGGAVIHGRLARSYYISAPDAGACMEAHPHTTHHNIAPRYVDVMDRACDLNLERCRRLHLEHLR